MRILRRIVVFDAADVDAESRFWAGLLGGTVHRDGDWHSVVVDGEWIIGVQRAPNHVPPLWPPAQGSHAQQPPAQGSHAQQPPAQGSQAQQQQVHLDLHVDDLAEAGHRALTFGGRQLQPVRAPADNPNGEERFAVYASPAGHPLCLGSHP